MIYCTKGEFIQALKDIKELEKRLYFYNLEYQKLHYKRFEKVKAPLDYEIVGYDGDESIVELKGRGGYVSQAQVLAANESMDRELDNLKDNINACQKRINNATKTLASISKPLRDILEDKYINSKTYSQIARKYDNVFVGITYDTQVKRYIYNNLDDYFQ